MGWICKHCENSQRVVIEGIVMWYCKAHHRYCPSKRFIEAWGCDEYEDTQLKLFKENING